MSRKESCGKYGVEMNSIEYRPRKKGNANCKECEHLVEKPTLDKSYKGKKNKLNANNKKRGVINSYWCKRRNEARHYTSRCYCGYFKKREADKRPETATSQKGKDILAALNERAIVERKGKYARKRGRKCK